MTMNLNDQQWLETYKSLINLSIEGFKFSALANGGAAIAILAYLGNVVRQGSAVPDMRTPMAGFILGLTLCGLSMIFAYLTQLQLLNEGRSVSLSKISHKWILWCAIFLFFLSIAAFGTGAWLAVLHFR